MNNSMKTPLIRLAKREGMDKRTVWAIRVGSILLALLLGALDYQGYVSLEMKTTDTDTVRRSLEYVAEVFGK